MSDDCILNRPPSGSLVDRDQFERDTKVAFMERYMFARAATNIGGMETREVLKQAEIGYDLLKRVKLFGKL